MPSSPLSLKKLVSSVLLCVGLLSALIVYPHAVAQDAKSTTPAKQETPKPQKAEYDPTSVTAKSEADAVKEEAKTKEPDGKRLNLAAGTGQPLLLWAVQSPTNTVFLYGTVHAGRNDFFPLPERVEKLFGASKVLVVEADVSNLSVLRDVAPLMTFTPPDTLETKLPKALFARFKKLAERYKVPVAEAQRFRPFLASSVIAMGELTEAGYEVRYGVDGYLSEQAKLLNKPLKELEGVGEQIKLFSQFTDAEALIWFENALSALESEKSRQQTKGLMDAWQSGDAEKLITIMKEYNAGAKDADKFDDKLLYSRHDAMVIKIASYLALKDEPHFVAVGALHLPGSKGLVAMLEKKGYKVTQLKATE
jgi:uncharacterized protein